MSKNNILDRAADALRVFMKDKPELNRLLGGKYENDPEALKLCIKMAVDDWNTTMPPLDSVTLDNHPSQRLLLYGAAIQALISASMWHSRERMPSADGGTSADDHAKMGEYSALIDRLSSVYESQKLNMKKSMNMAMAFGGLASEYAGYSRRSEGLF